MLVIVSILRVDCAHFGEITSACFRIIWKNTAHKLTMAAIPPIDHQMWDAERTGNLVVVIWFLDNGWDVDRINRGGTAMHVAARYGRVLIARTLLRRGANLEAREARHGATPLLIATRHQHVAFVQWCLRHNATPNVTGGRSGG